MKRQGILVCVFLFLFTALLEGCGQGNKEAKYHIYYVSKDYEKIVETDYEDDDAEDTVNLIGEFLDILITDPDTADYTMPLPEDVVVDSYNLDKNKLYIYFNSAYGNMDTAREVLARAAIVKTLIQLEDVDCVSFFVDGMPLKDAKEKLVGFMDEESFVENPGEQINSVSEADLTLYFANKEGDGLVEEKRHVPYSTSMSMEKLVMEQLMEGPDTEGLQSTIPQGTRLVSVSVLDGVCMVNLDESFLNQNYEISEGVIIYSIVNSLTKSSNVAKVQISVNGETDLIYRDKFQLNEYYEQDFALLEDTEDDQTKEENVTVFDEETETDESEE